MSKKQVIMLVSWCFIGLALYISNSISTSEDVITPLIMGNLAIATFIWIREHFSTDSETRYWESALNLTNRFRVAGLIYMLAWLVYILYKYFTNIDKGERILTDQMLILFMAPVLMIFVFHEIVWFVKCRNQG